MKIGMVQRICVLAAAIIAIGSSFLQATGALGLTPAEFANSGASTVRAASYAFAIWGLIYIGLLVYAIYQLVPGWASDIVLQKFGWPSAISMLAIGIWLVAAGADWRWATVALIALAAISLIAPLTLHPADVESHRDGLFVVSPLALLAGWLTIATALNTITVLTAEGFIDEPSATGWAVTGLVFAIAITSLVFLRSRSFAYPLPVIWGLIAVYVAESSQRPAAAWLALTGVGVLVGLIAWRVLTQMRYNQPLRSNQA